MQITYFDVEYANARNQSICQIGMVCEDFETGETVYPALDLLVNPEDRFDRWCVEAHGISADRVKDAKTLPQLWPELEKYLINSVVVGHHIAHGDLDALVKNLKRYHLDIPQIYYICTQDLARACVPQFAVCNYALQTLCRYFEIDPGRAHHAYEDAKAAKALLQKLVSVYQLDLTRCVRPYEPQLSWEQEESFSNPVVRRSISEFYGLLSGISIDREITREEVASIRRWAEEHRRYETVPELAAMVQVVDKITEDGRITLAEMEAFRAAIGRYLTAVSTSKMTLATQVLDGILEGILVDRTITTEEGLALQQWLYDNQELLGHYPFDKILPILEEVLQDAVITAEESRRLTEAIHALLDPVEALRSQVLSVAEKHICLSGSFAYGTRSEVEDYLTHRGAEIDRTLKKSTDFLMIGACESVTYVYGSDNAKVRKALDYNSQGSQIRIVREQDLLR